MQLTPPEGFLLLSLPNCTLSSTGFSEAGVLGLECVTLPHPEASSANERDVYLVLRLNMSETPIDPARVIQRSDKADTRTYTFYSIPTDPSEFILTIPATVGDSKKPLHEDLNTFDSILEQYANDFRVVSQTGSAVSSGPPPAYVNDQKDLRGHLVMINEDTGEVVGEVEDRFRVKEDPLIHQPGHENDPVMIEVPDEAGLRESDATAIEVFARIIPPDQQDWITKSATVVSHAISYTTGLVLTAITTASDYYVSHSRPSPHHSSTNNLNENEKSSRQPSGTAANPPPLPPRALVFLTSESTRNGLRSVHTVSSQAVKVSAKTVKTIDNMIRRAMGAAPKRPRLTGYRPTPPASLSPVPSVNHSTLAPTAVYPSHTQQWNSDTKPPLPPRRTPSPQPPPLPSRQAFPPNPPSLPPRSSMFNRSTSAASLEPQAPPNLLSSDSSPPKISKVSRVLISADLILSTIDDSARRVLDTSTTSFGRVMHHKYGPEAAESSLLAAGTARNVGLVYVDMRGIGRRALLRRAGMNFVKARVQKNEPHAGGGHAGGSGSGRPAPPVPQKQ